MRSRQYGPDVLAAARRRPGLADAPRVAAGLGMVVEDSAGEFCGAVVGWEKDAVTLEDRHGRRRVFPFAPGAFLLEGQRITLTRPASGPVGPDQAAAQGGTAQGQRPAGPRRTASGSIAAPVSRAKVARASRIYVEGRHDAELVEQIWGDDLRDVGVVVEFLGGIDDLPAIVSGFSPGPGRRLGVLVDHLVAGSKETRIAAQVSSPHVLIVGHPFIDIWSAVRPAAVGISGWPRVPPGTPWKQGVLRAIGWPEDTAAAWQRILRAVRGFADLEPELLGRVEELIDFVTEPGAGDLLRGGLSRARRSARRAAGTPAGAGAPAGVDYPVCQLKGNTSRARSSGSGTRSSCTRAQAGRRAPRSPTPDCLW